MIRGRDTMGEHGRSVPASSSKLRPPALDELRAYGGARLFRGKRVMDIGSGDGRLTFGPARWASEVLGLDQDPNAVRAARRKARELGVRNVRFGVAPAQQLPVRDRSFDVVILSWTL